MMFLIGLYSLYILSDIKVNIIRPGYVFGNPVIEGAYTEGDRRFFDIVKNALANKPIYLTKNDGTQFVSATDLAKLYIEILNSDVNRKTYFGLSKNFVSWEKIAKTAINLTGSKSEIILQDNGLVEDQLSWDVSEIKQDFNLEFDPWNQIIEHLNYIIKLSSTTHRT